jgi:magnesium-transporting ATPase (P-type)
LRSVVVLLLVAAAALSLAIGDHVEAAAIAVVLVINAGLGFTTDWRARQAMAALLQRAWPIPSTWPSWRRCLCSARMPMICCDGIRAAASFLSRAPAR